MLEKNIDIKSIGNIAVVEVEKRKMERFDLALTAYLSQADKRENDKSFELLTSNISAGGAYFKTNKPCKVGTDVKLKIILPLNKFKNLMHKASYIVFSGTVIRTDQKGMAVCFDKEYKFLPQ